MQCKTSHLENIQIPTDFQPHVSYIQRKRAFNELINRYVIKQTSRVLHKLAWSSSSHTHPQLDEKWNVSDFSFTLQVVEFNLNVYSNWVLLTHNFIYFNSKLIQCKINNEKIATDLKWRLFVSADSKVC